MLDPVEAGGGCLRNLGSHGMDMFLHLTGEDAKVTGAQVSRLAHQQRIEDFQHLVVSLCVGPTFRHCNALATWPDFSGHTGYMRPLAVSDAASTVVSITSFGGAVRTSGSFMIDLTSAHIGQGVVAGCLGEQAHLYTPSLWPTFTISTMRSSGATV